MTRRAPLVPNEIIMRARVVAVDAESVTIAIEAFGFPARDRRATPVQIRITRETAETISPWSIAFAIAVSSRIRDTLTPEWQDDPS